MTASTTEIYSEIIIENIIKKYLQRGEVPTIAQIEEEFDAVAATQDLTSSDFTSTEWTVERKEKGSASKFNGGFEEVETDLLVLYKTLLENTGSSAELYQKWQIKADKLENKVKGLEIRIANLLLRSRETDGYFNTVGDKFTDTSKIDLTLSNGVAIDLKQNIVSINRSSVKYTVPDRIFLNDIRQEQVLFNVITRSNVTASNNTDNTLPHFAFLDSDLYWKAKVVTNEKVSPLTTELVLTLDEAIDVSKIDMELLSSDNSSGVSITPMYSADGINYFKLPSQVTTIVAQSKATIQFGTVEIKKLKFILEKTSHDYKEDASFVYEFGFKEIQLLAPGFAVTDEDDKPTLYSIPLSIEKEDGTLARFNKLTLEVCDGISSETRIDYYLSVGKQVDSGVSWLAASGVSLDQDDRLWFPISPLNRDVLFFPDVLDLASIGDHEVEDIRISYDSAGGDNFTSPGQTFNSIGTVDNSVDITTASADLIRYEFLHENQKILDYQLDPEADIDLDSLVLWRNVGEKGLFLPDSTKMVRGNPAGWEYREPYYYTFCLIENPSGLAIDVGNKPITIDSSIQTGKIVLSPGTHSVKIHQDYWNYVDPELETLSQLKAQDVLYPYNQKLLIEGYQYPDTWKEEKVYPGTDRFAGYLMDQVSPFDFMQNTGVTDYSKFKLDSQIPDTVTGAANSKVILLNVDMSRADFINEQFLLEFKLTDELYSFVALKAEMSTSNSSLTPVLDEYKIKIGL